MSSVTDVPTAVNTTSYDDWMPLHTATSLPTTPRTYGMFEPNGVIEDSRTYGHIEPGEPPPQPEPFRRAGDTRATRRTYLKARKTERAAQRLAAYQARKAAQKAPAALRQPTRDWPVPTRDWPVTHRHTHTGPINWHSADMIRFNPCRGWMTGLTAQQALDIVRNTTLPFGTTAFDFDPTTDTIVKGPLGNPALFTMPAPTGPVSFEIIRRISKRGYMVKLKDHTLEEISLNPGGLRYLDKLIAEEQDEVLPIRSDFDRDATKDELKLYHLFCFRGNKEPHTFKRKSTNVYDTLGLKIKLWHRRLCNQRTYDTAGKRAGQPAPVIAELDDWADIDTRKLNPTQDNMDDGPWHAHGRPTWLKSPGNDPETCDWAGEAEAQAYSKQLELFKSRGNILGETGGCDPLPIVKQLQKTPGGKWAYVIKPWVGNFRENTARLQAKIRHADEAHEYNKRIKGLEEDAQPEWAGSVDDPQQPPYWPYRQDAQLRTAWQRALAVSEIYDRVGKVQASELTGRVFTTHVDRTPESTRQIVGTTADGFITAGEESPDYHQHLLAEADRQLKLQLGLWVGNVYQGKPHPASLMVDGKGATCTPKDWCKQARMAAVERLKALAVDNESTRLEDQAVAEKPELGRLLDKAACKPNGDKVFERLLKTRIKLHKIHTQAHVRDCRKIHRLLVTGQITDRKAALRRHASAIKHKLVTQTA